MACEPLYTCTLIKNARIYEYSLTYISSQWSRLTVYAVVTYYRMEVKTEVENQSPDVHKNPDNTYTVNNVHLLSSVIVIAKLYYI